LFFQNLKYTTNNFDQSISLISSVISHLVSFGNDYKSLSHHHEYYGSLYVSYTVLAVYPTAFKNKYPKSGFHCKCRRWHRSVFGVEGRPRWLKRNLKMVKAKTSILGNGTVRDGETVFTLTAELTKDEIHFGRWILWEI